MLFAKLLLEFQANLLNLVRDKAAQTTLSDLTVGVIVLEVPHELALDFAIGYILDISECRKLLEEKGFCFLHLLTEALAKTIHFY